MAGSNPQALTTTQYLILIVYGALLWFGAALLLRALAPMGALDGSALVLTYALIIPGTLPAVFLARRLARLDPSQTAIGLTVVTAAAILLDGTAFGWFPGLYAATLALQLKAAATILWGAGVGLVLGPALNRTAPRA